MNHMTIVFHTELSAEIRQEMRLFVESLRNRHELNVIVREEIQAADPPAFSRFFMGFTDYLGDPSTRPDC